MKRKYSFIQLIAFLSEEENFLFKVFFSNPSKFHIDILKEKERKKKPKTNEFLIHFY